MNRLDTEQPKLSSAINEELNKEFDILNPEKLTDFDFTNNIEYEGEILLDNHPDIQIYYHLTRNSLDLQFQGSYEKIGEKIVIQFRSSKVTKIATNYQTLGECPSLAYWFRKDNASKVSWSLSLACKKDETVTQPQWSLTGDFERDIDDIVTYVHNIPGQQYFDQWKFKGLRKFSEQNLTDFGFDDFKYVRIFAASGEYINDPIDEFVEIKKKNA